MIRKLLLSCGIGLGLLLGMGNTFAFSATRLTFVTNYPIRHPVNTGIHYLADLVEERSKGKYKLNVIDNGKCGSVSAEMQALQSGTVHFMVESTGSCEPFFSALSVFDLPYTITNYESNLADILLGPVVTDILDSFGSKRVKILSVMGCGPRYLFTTKPVKKLEDVKGLKMRTTPSRLHMDIVKALGMAPTPLAWTELYTSLQQGVVEGCDPELPSGPAMSFRDVAPYWAKFDVSANVGLIFVNARWWGSLPQADRDMFMQTIHDAARSILTEQQSVDRDIIAAEEAAGRTVFIPSPEEKQRWIDATKDVYKEHSNISEDAAQKLRGLFK